ncbi:P-loop containing nucleoside triphosphate hydrolase protein [Fragilariopsis cylindrus CCMP1102]|uniref:Elongation factor Tu, chloroplastic n=1 Tax=Fragilariopsis cylindrus CCMP1102 TaxID=635003 RepID=A0A1E7EQ27_9STRA|nr:P-loop containing nucleoside triphosphate hydrolase protein [Fragilariopsis cylindrus CCMP1102]|eukprot:OEU08059.1 P-loop containing nucleoside triphosphate hydrolase protein [Fragilariopsis cylindrus CCMP1102]
MSTTTTTTPPKTSSDSDSGNADGDHGGSDNSNSDNANGKKSDVDSGSTSTSTSTPPSTSTSITSTSPPNPEEVININVGILGHVDSGKTSLVKTLSTLLSTASLDKSKQSRQRGMTLDLGFSCFFMDLPERLKLQLQASSNNKSSKDNNNTNNNNNVVSKSKSNKLKYLQMTLVDCPGHASLIRTIIGGAQIIDIVLLVVDAYKGWQAQTTECLVLAELTSSTLIIALNKIDMFPIAEREQRLQEATQKVRERLKQSTKFNDPSQVPIIGVSACMGGEKVAAVAIDKGTNTNTNGGSSTNSNSNSNFYFAIDHCFPIKGMGTVLTGTCLNGSINVNDIIEFPSLGNLQRKVKSIQMFKRRCLKIQQGDRAGICVSNFDSTSLERGVCSTPGSVKYVKGGIALVRKIIPHYKGPYLKNKSKYHVSVGHSTVMATVSFWGAKELELKLKNEVLQDKERASANGGVSSTKTNGSNGNDQDNNGTIKNNKQKQPESLLHWAILDFQTPVYCPLQSLIIGSRLDAPNNKASSCRLAFCGRLIERLTDPSKDIHKIRWYTPKEKRGIVSRLGDPHKRQDDSKTVRYELYGSDLFKKETLLKPFLGMKLITYPSNDIGELKSAFGTSGKFRVVFPSGTTAKENDILRLPFKRFLYDTEKKMRQDDIILPASRSGSRIDPPASTQSKKDKKKKRKDLIEATGTVDKVKGDPIIGSNNGGSGSGSGGEDDGSTKKTTTATKKVVYPTAIISGLFTPDIDIKSEMVGRTVYIPSTKEYGTITGPFGKAGKCKVDFIKNGGDNEEESNNDDDDDGNNLKGISESAVGSKAELHRT